ncbi:MAG TPA: RidA family protein, partial [Burkholderiaceae bacterium]|nr:RidA family protein [Burkholderiaceae bacterium]
MSKTVLQPVGWAAPKGYANGVAVSLPASGRLVFVAGQIGWNAASQFDSDDLVDQVLQALL